MVRVRLLKDLLMTKGLTGTYVFGSLWIRLTGTYGVGTLWISKHGRSVPSQMSKVSCPLDRKNPTVGFIRICCHHWILRTRIKPTVGFRICCHHWILRTLLPCSDDPHSSPVPPFLEMRGEPPVSHLCRSWYPPVTHYTCTVISFLLHSSDLG